MARGTRGARECGRTCPIGSVYSQYPPFHGTLKLAFKRPTHWRQEKAEKTMQKHQKSIENIRKMTTVGHRDGRSAVVCASMSGPVFTELENVRMGAGR